jgi:hypothetical protein
LLAFAGVSEADLLLLLGLCRAAAAGRQEALLGPLLAADAAAVGRAVLLLLWCCWPTLGAVWPLHAALGRHLQMTTVQWCESVS